MKTVKDLSMSYMRKSLRDLALFIIKRLGVGSHPCLNVCLKKMEPDWWPLMGQEAMGTDSGGFPLKIWK